jgi:ABC-type phosphate/phosphonate transport system permease subunit
LLTLLPELPQHSNAPPPPIALLHGVFEEDLTIAWNQVTVILLVILATVATSEWLSARVCHAAI